MAKNEAALKALECYNSLPLVYDGWDEDEVVQLIASDIQAAYTRGLEDAANLCAIAATNTESDEAELELYKAAHEIRKIGVS